MDLFEVISALLNRLQVFEEVFIPKKLSDIFVEILSQLLVLFGVVTKAIRDKRFCKPLLYRLMCHQ